MEMQDNEFDELFRLKLDSFETEPSANVWPGIEKELNVKSSFRKLLPLISMAATLLVVLSFGVFFINKEKPVKPYQASNRINLKKETNSLANTARTGTSAPQAIISSAVGANQLALVTPQRKEVKMQSPKDGQCSKRQETANGSTATERLLASNTPLREDIDHPGVPGNNLSSSIQTINPLPDFNNEAARLTAKLNAPATGNSVPIAQRKARSLGDMFNVVIAKVDKRKDKFIEFSDTDDDEYSITGVNLGIIKIKKDK